MIREIFKKIFTKIKKLFIKIKNYENIEKIDNREIEKKIINKIEQDTKKLKEKAINYYILRYLDDYIDSYELSLQIKKDYPPIYAQPYFPRYLDLKAEEIKIFEKIINEKIKNYPKKDLYTPLDAYETMILEKAENEAKEILLGYKNVEIKS